MCFSAEASFGTGIVLGVIGVVTIKKARTLPMQLFAAIPLIFSVQQFTEGFLWLSITHQIRDSWHQLFTHIFLVFAYVVWPIWIPLTTMLLEQDQKLRKIIKLLLITGILISIYIAYCLFFYQVNSSVSAHHILYTFKFPHVLNGFTWASDMYYFIATIPALFISSVKRMWIFGIILVASYIISRVFFNHAVISVWCFFAASLSFVVLLIIMNTKKSFSQT